MTRRGRRCSSECRDSWPRPGGPKRRQIAVGENGKHPAAVGGGRGSGVAGVLKYLGWFCRALWRSGRGLPPKELPAIGVEAVDLAATLIGAGEEQPLAPDDRRVVARQRHGRFPDDSLARRGVPGVGHVRKGRHPEAARPTESRPRLGDFLIGGRRFAGKSGRGRFLAIIKQWRPDAHAQHDGCADQDGAQRGDRPAGNAGRCGLAVLRRWRHVGRWHPTAQRCSRSGRKQEHNDGDQQ